MMQLVGFSIGRGEVARYLGIYGSEHVNKAVFISAIPPFLLKTSDNKDGGMAMCSRRLDGGLSRIGWHFYLNFSWISTMSIN